VIPGRALRVVFAAAGLAVMALGALWVAAAVQAAPPPAPAVGTPQAYFPIFYQPVLPTPTGTPPPVTPPAATDWYDVLLYYRASARLPALAENTTWSAGAVNHAAYMVTNDVLAYTEDPATPGYTTSGATEAANSNLMLSDNVSTSDQQALDFWMEKPFHALGLLDPALLSTGFGSYRQDDGPFDPYRMGAVVDVRQGLGAIPGSVTFPIKWPDHNTTVYLTSYDGNEQPDPLTSCPGYSPPSGLPIILQLGGGGSTFSVSAYSVLQGSTALAVCELDSTNYINAFDANLQTLGRQILAASDAVVLIPQQPLARGLSYTASVTANGAVYTWTFNVAP
jgi:uncharacterized protein YkwD